MAATQETTEATSGGARALRLLRRPFDLFVAVAERGGVLLLLALTAAMIWKNVDAGSYDAVWAAGVDVNGGRVDGLAFVNDAAMAVFFLVVGAEIKRELVVGELRGARRAAVPVLAALGGMLVPAALYVVVAPAQRQGFGTPMATDIAFALAAIRVLGARVPSFVVKVLMGLAIIDDLGAIVVIAVFYGGHVDVAALGGAAACVVVVVGCNVAGVERVVVYLVAGVPLWWALHEGGIHPTIAGVVVGLAVPARSAVVDVTAPLERLVTALSPWIHWLILPVFALANGGIDLGGVSLATLWSPVSAGVVVGLVVGKQLGIFATVFACVKAGLLPLPNGVRFGHLWGMAILGGVGFTMSLFVAALAFDVGSVEHTEAKTGILVGSTLSALLGLAVLRAMPMPTSTSTSEPEPEPAA